MWTQVGVDDDAELTDSASLFSQASGGTRTIDVPTLRTAIASGIADIYFYTSGAQKLVLYVEHNRKRGRYTLCTAFQGGQPASVLDTLITQVKQLVPTYGVSAMFAIYPLSLPDNPLKQLLNLIRRDPRIIATMLTTTSDSEVWKYESP